MDKLNDAALSKAIDSAEAEIKLKKSTQKTKPISDIKETQTTKRGSKTVKTTTKKTYKKPELFKNHPLAQSINTFANKWAMSEDIATESMFGESVVLTIDYYLTDLPDHPLIYVAMSGAMVAFAGLSNRGMIPDFGKTEKKEKTPEEIQLEKNRQTIKTKNTNTMHVKTLGSGEKIELKGKTRIV